MLRKSLFLFLTLALLAVPVFLLAHAFTHYAQTDVLDAAGSEADASVDLDEICFDCVALTALNFILIASGLLLRNPANHRRLPLWAMGHHSNRTTLPYCSRAPPFQLL
ncbi:MAG: hypothetical protein KBF68_09920 [Nitrosomonas sp.]|uniref:DUF2946 domain-containing protein n=1 Tax=Nitrosomonas oligotropha TaxID=42354 RepID=A0A5C7VKV1_9PROT|nr:hypothetical protein [Nitrosomonas sp.]TXI26316.1 MAG: hypothetical protein E6Q60_12785 [Nitrosomonas oligotropha]